MCGVTWSILKHIDYVEKGTLINGDGIHSTIKQQLTLLDTINYLSLKTKILIQIIITTEYIDKNDTFQIVYLDSISTSALQYLVSYCVDICSSSILYKENNNNNANYHSPKQLQIISYETSELSKIMFSFDVKESAQFFYIVYLCELLFNKQKFILKVLLPTAR